MPGINSILDLGRNALFASTSAIEVTSNNISNVNTPGYARQAVRLEDGISIDYRPGQIGTGVKAKEVFRYFNEFVEEQFTGKNATQFRWEATYENLRSIDSLFSESQEGGINAAIAQFWQDWQDLSSHPELKASREALMGNTQSLISSIHVAEQDMRRLQNQMDEFIAQDVETINDLISQIADVNQQIQSHDVPGENNANQLRDKRVSLVRQLSEKLDVDYIDNGGGDFTVQTKAGHTLVHGVETFEVKFEAAKTSQSLVPGSTFDGDIYFEGSDDFEYTVEVVSGGPVQNGAGAAEFRVSLDGGQTWMKNDDGSEKHFAARPDEGMLQVGDVKLYFGSKSDPNVDPAGTLSVGDSFTVVPKKGLYWYKTTSTPLNITPQVYANGADNERRLTGGTLAGYFSFRDQHIGRYRDKLDATAKALIFEVNRLHSQGMGEQNFTTATGTYSVDSTTNALASNSSGLPFASRLQNGNIQLYVYDQSNGSLITSDDLDFGGGANFDASAHSLQDVVDAINNTFPGQVTASIANGRLKMDAAAGTEFAFGTDTAGLAAALGVNTFFEGEDARTLEVNANVKSDLDLIATGHVNGAGEVNSGDNEVALSIAQLADKNVAISTSTEGTTMTTIAKYFNGLVAAVGGDTSSAKFNFEYNKTLAKDLDERQQETAGVNLDEEMGNLVKFQHSYTAAAKLITAADRMMQTLLGLKN